MKVLLILAGAGQLGLALCSLALPRILSHPTGFSTALRSRAS